MTFLNFGTPSMSIITSAKQQEKHVHANTHKRVHAHIHTYIYASDRDIHTVNKYMYPSIHTYIHVCTKIQLGKFADCPAQASDLSFA